MRRRLWFLALLLLASCAPNRAEENARPARTAVVQSAHCAWHGAWAGWTTLVVTDRGDIEYYGCKTFLRGDTIRVEQVQP